MDRIDADKVIRMLESGYALPPLSVIALKLLEVASNEDASNDQIVTIIEQDPSLTVRLLKPSKYIRLKSKLNGFDKLGAWPIHVNFQPRQ